MNPNLIHLLACPYCQGELDLHVQEGSPESVVLGSFQCRDCAKVYEIKEDIPFFSPVIQHSGVKNQQDTYSTWWDAYHDEHSIVNPETRDFFYNSLRMKADEMEGRVVLDAGCGNGRFSFVVSHYQPKLLVSFDISSGVLHARKAITKHNPGASVAYVQGDVTRPPFKKGVFDLAFSWGVIHHTPDTQKTFSTVASLVREGGRLGIYVYEFHPYYRFDRQWLSFAAYLRSLFLIKPLRFLCSRLSAKTVHRIFIPIYHVERLLNLGIMGCHGYPEDKWNRDRYFRVVIDRFKTRYASEHELEEVMGWFWGEGFNELCVGLQPRVSLSGTKTGSAESLTLTIQKKLETDESSARYFVREAIRKVS